MSARTIPVQLVGGPGCGRMVDILEGAREIVVPLAGGRYVRGGDGRYYWRERT